MQSYAINVPICTSDDTRNMYTIGDILLRKKIVRNYQHANRWVICRAEGATREESISIDVVTDINLSNDNQYGINVNKVA